MDTRYKLQLVEQIIKNSRPVYIFGTNDYASTIATKVKIDGFINDITNEKEFEGIQIVKLSELPKDAIVISCVVLARPLYAITKIKEWTKDVLEYYFFQKHSGLKIPEVIFNNDKSFENEYSTHKNYYDNLQKRLKDERSKEVLDKIIKFRLSGDVKYLANFSFDPTGQYFDSCVEFNDKEVFLDVGCFDGYTSLEFINHVKSFDKIYVFEPESKNMSTVRSNLAKHKNKVEFIESGLSYRSMTLKFESSGSSSKISSEGDCEIRVQTLDSMNLKNVSYIKMDIEGAELDALKGSNQTIKDCHPKLAISVYHKADDLRKIPEYILSIRNDYDIYLRHYTEGVTETVMYFLPKKND